MQEPYKGFGALRKGRQSQPEAEYFITICLQRPSVALTDVLVSGHCWKELRRLEREGAMSLRCAVMMPDHLHLLIKLGPTLNLSATIRLFKGRLTSILRQFKSAWQPSFYDHQLNPEEDVLPIFLYIFLNPYRKGLINTEQIWSGYYCASEDWAWFKQLTKESRPEPAWLA